MFGLRIRCVCICVCLCLHLHLHLGLLFWVAGNHSLKSLTHSLAKCTASHLIRLSSYTHSFITTAWLSTNLPHNRNRQPYRSPGSLNVPPSTRHVPAHPSSSLKKHTKNHRPSHELSDPMPHSHRLPYETHSTPGVDGIQPWAIHIGRFSVSHPETKAETKCPKKNFSPPAGRC